MELQPAFKRLGRDDQNDDYMCGYTDGWNHCIKQLTEISKNSRIDRS